MQYFLSLPILSQIGIVYILIINIVTFFFFGFDKLQSTIEGRQRVSEFRLWFLSFIGGSIGALLGMKFFRHKTKKLSFQAGIALILAVQIILIYFLLTK